ncbi:MAG TPA: hypothetical protein DCW68_05505 [Rhodospirillaceae bacterium]|nr:hypothetical protein [Rhodospirillaceae bacterium]
MKSFLSFFVTAFTTLWSTATIAGSETVTLRATNQTGQTAEQTFTLNVAQGSHSEWIYLPASSVSGVDVPAFAIMKYEAAGNPAAPAAGSLSATYTWANCRTACQAIGPGYDMIKESQWNRIAHDLLNNPNNWTGGAVGSGKLFYGIATPAASSTDDANGYIGATGTSQYERRTMALSTGDVIWDIARNRLEWTYADDGRTGAGASAGLTQLSITSTVTNDARVYTGRSTYTNTETTDLNATPFPTSNADCKPGGSYTYAEHNVGQRYQHVYGYYGYNYAYPERGYNGIMGWLGHCGSYTSGNAYCASSLRTGGCRCALNNPPAPDQANHLQNP